MFCLFWKSQPNNGSRALCHRLPTTDETSHDITDDTTDDTPDEASDETSDDVECICSPSLALSCITGRSHQTFNDLKHAFFRHFDAIRFEKQHGVFTNKLGRCPLCNKEFIQRSKMSSLNDFMKYDNVNLLVRHLNLVHGAEMEEVARV